MKYVTWIVVIAVLVWAGWAIFHRKGAEVANAEPIKIGVIAPLSGDAASYGEPARNVYQMAIEEINAAGGVNGSQLELVIEDSKCDSATAASAVQKLINIDKVQVIIGGFCSSESLAATPIAEAAKVLLFSPGSSSPDLTGKSPFFVRNYPSDASQGAVLAQVAWDKGWKKVAFIQETKDYPLGIFKAFEAKFTALGGNTVKEEFPSDATDFRTQLTKLKAANADALFIDPQTPAAGERIFKQISDMKWAPHIILNDVAGDPASMKKYSKLLEGALFAVFNVSGNPRYTAFADKYKAKYNVTDVPFPNYAQTEYDNPFIIAEGLKAVGNDGAKLAAWVHTVKDWQGAAGNVTIGADGDVVGGHSPMIVKDGVGMSLSAVNGTSTSAQ